MTCYRHHRRLHNVPWAHACENLSNTVTMTFRGHWWNMRRNTIQSPVPRLMTHTMTSARAWGYSNRLPKDTAMVVDLARQENLRNYSSYSERIASKYARILRRRLSDSGTQSKFWLRPVSIKRNNLQKSSTVTSANESPTVLPVERSATKEQSHRLASTLSTLNESHCIAFGAKWRFSFLDELSISVLHLQWCKIVCSFLVQNY